MDPRFQASVEKWNAILEQARQQAQASAPTPTPAQPTKAAPVTKAPVSTTGSTPVRQAPEPWAAIPWKTGTTTTSRTTTPVNRAGAIPLPPQAKEVENPWWDVGPKEEAKRWAPGMKSEPVSWLPDWMTKSFSFEDIFKKDAPQWLSDLENLGSYIEHGSRQRVQEAWEKPELRYQTRLPGGMEAEEPTGQKPGATDWLDKVKEDPVKAVVGVGKAIGEGWDKAAGKSGLLRTAEQGAAAGLSILDSIGRVPKQIYGASVVSAHPESEGVPMEDWAPLASIAPSLVTKQLKSGKSVFEEGILDKDSSLGEALRRIKTGEDAYEVANELYDPWAEIVTEIATDPLNALDFLSVGNKLKRGAAITKSQRMMTEAVDQSPAARRMLDNWQRELAEHATAEADILKTASDVLGEPGAAKFWDKVKASAPARMFDLTPAAKADRDLGDFWVVAAGPMSEVKSADEAIDLARKWADAPEELAEYGAIVNSPTGQKARVIWKHLADALPDLPSVQAEQFNPVRFMVDVTETAKDALRKAYNYKEPNAIDKFLNAYKGIQSEFYLSGVFSPGYVLRNSASDLFTMAMDGVGTFERRTNIDDFMTRFGMGTQRTETKGAGQAAMRYGLKEEPKSVLPGPLGTASKKGQEISRHAEPGGVLPLGEEPRYSRAQYKALTRFLDTNSLRSTPEIPAVFRSILGDQTADALRAAVSKGLSKQEKVDALNSVLDAKTPLQAFDPSRYLDPVMVDALEPELYKRLVDAARKMPATATPDDWRGLVKRISDEVEAVAEERLSKLESLPARKVATDTEEAEILDDLTATLKDLANDPNPNISGGAQRLMDQFQQVTAEIAKARDEAMNAAAQTQHPDAMRVLYAAMTKAEEMRTEARAGLDGLMRETVNAYRQRKAGAADWARYFFAKAQGELNLAGQRAQVFGEAQEQLRRLRNGEDVSAVLGKSGYDLSVEAMQRAAKVDVPEMPRGFAPGSVRNATEDAQFQQMLKAARGQTQAKEAEAWRIAFSLEPGSYGEALDLLKSADGDVAMAGKRAAGKVREARQRYFEKAKEAKTRAEFDKLFSGFYAERNKIWNDLRAETIERWDQVQRDLMMRNWNPAHPPDLMVSASALPGDAELLQEALRTNPANWTDEMKAALERWMGEAKPPKTPPEKLDEATRIARGTGLPTWTPKNSEADLRRALYDQMIAKAGVGEPPHLADLIAAQSDATRKALSQIEDGVLNDWQTWQPVMVNEATKKGLAQWLDAEVMPRWHETRATALQYARTQADDALLDYNNRRNFDTWIARVVPYHYWFTRSGYNWSKRIATNPALLTHYVRVRDAQRMANEQAGRRQRFGASFEVPFPWLPDWMGDSLYVDPMAMVLPYANFMRMNWDDGDEASQGMRAIRDQMDKIGFRPYHFMDLPYQNGWLAKLGEGLGMDADKARQTLSPDVQGGFSYILPQTQIIKSLTAGKGDWGPQGLNIEGMLRQAAGLPKGDVWDPYRVSRMLANLAAESPKDAGLARSALMAQELLNRDPEQKEKLWEAGNPIALAAQEQYGWTDGEVKAAQELLSLAMVRAQQERGMGMLGWALGPRVSIEPEGERTQMELAEEARGQIWTGDNGGSREAYQQYKLDNPALYPRSQQYEVIPGESDWEGMASGARANWLTLTKKKQEVIDRYQTLIDKHLRANPHDWDGRNALMDKRKGELDALKAKYPLPPIEEDLPPVLYGMNPKEMWDSVVEDVGYELQGQEPVPDAFKDAKGAIDWGRYYDARDEWLTSLPKTLPGVGAVLGGSYAGMTTAEAYEAFERRYHTPLEAANRVYQEAIAGAAWDQYNALKAQEEEQWPGMKALQDQYYSWPKGSQERREFLDAHPELKTYWDRERIDAYDSTVGAVGEMAARELIPVILATYKSRGWTEAELKKALKGVVFPALAAQSKKSTSKSSAKSAASDAGIPYWSDYTPGLENEDWRSAVGKPWWEKYPKKSYSKKTSYAKKRYSSSYPDDDWDDWDEDNGGGWRTYQEAPKWQYRRTIYGGPQWG